MGGKIQIYFGFSLLVFSHRKGGGGCHHNEFFFKTANPLGGCLVRKGSRVLAEMTHGLLYLPCKTFGKKKMTR